MDPQPSIAAPRRQRGQALIEYSVIVMLAVLILVANPNLVMEVVQAMRKAYEGFVYAISLSWI